MKKKAVGFRLEAVDRNPESGFSYRLKPTAYSLVRPYAGRLALVLAVSLTGTLLSLVIPYLSKDLVDKALLGRDPRSLLQITALFVGVTVISFLLNMAG